MESRRVRRAIDSGVSLYCLYPDDFEKPYFVLPQGIERDGVEV